MKHEPKRDHNIPGRYYCTCGAAGLTLEGQRVHAERFARAATKESNDPTKAAECSR